MVSFSRSALLRLSLDRALRKPVNRVEHFAPQCRRVSEVIEREPGGVVTPEQLVIDNQRWHAKYAVGDGLFRVLAQCLFDLRIGQRLRRIDNAKCLGELLPLASTLQSSAMASRSGGSGLNGWLGGSCMAMPSRRASHNACLNTNWRFGAISAGPSWP
jgi:hypothetical protein